MHFLGFLQERAGLRAAAFHAKISESFLFLQKSILFNSIYFYANSSTQLRRVLFLAAKATKSRL